MSVFIVHRLDNFFVKLTNTQPVLGQPLSLNYTLCAQYNGTVGILSTATVTCSADVQSYRYLVVQGSLQAANALCLTEVIVYTGECHKRILQLFEANILCPLLYFLSYETPKFWARNFIESQKFEISCNRAKADKQLCEQNRAASFTITP